MKIDTKNFFVSTLFVFFGLTSMAPLGAAHGADKGEEETFDVINVELRPLNSSGTNAPRSFTIVKASDQDQLGGATAIVSCDAARSTLKSGDETFRFPSDLNCEKLARGKESHCDQTVTVDLQKKTVTYVPGPCVARRESEKKVDIRTELDTDLEEAGIKSGDSLEEGFLFRKEKSAKEKPSKVVRTK